MDAIEKEVEKVTKRQKQFYKNSCDLIDKMVHSLSMAKNNPAQVKDQTQVRITEFNTDLQSTMKDYYGALSKVQKSIEKKFSGQDLDAAFRSELFEGYDKYVDQAISLHFIREGLFDLNEQFSVDMKLNCPYMSNEALSQLKMEEDRLKAQFSQLYEICSSIDRGDLSLALQWCKINDQDLNKKGSSLEFELKRMQYLLLLSGRDTSGQLIANDSLRVIKALNYARSELSSYGDKYLKDLNKLMTSIVFSSTPKDYYMWNAAHVTNPYDFLLPQQGNQIAEKSQESQIQKKLDTLKQKFTRDFCGLIGMSQESPLLNVIDVGVNAVPILVKLRTVIDEGLKRNKRKREDEEKAKNLDENGSNLWTTLSDVLPIELPLPKSKRYHSVFACPVSREQTNDLNPPMMLPCGHVLSLDSLVRVAMKGRAGAQIASTTDNPPTSTETEQDDQTQELRSRRERERDLFAGVNTNAKLKCPYCPQECTVGQGQRVYF